METKNQVCKVCNGNLKKFISFGKMPVANAFLKKEQLNAEEFFYDMEVGFCENCFMIQMINLVSYEKYIVPDKRGKTHYAFFSSTSSVMEKHFKDAADEIKRRFLLNSNNTDDKVLEIGCNDGIFLKNFDNKKVLGIEPSENVADISRERNISVISEFFTEKLAENIAYRYGKFRVIFSANVILNIIEIHEVVEGVKKLLEDKGVFIMEDPYIVDILESNSYDQIYDEHIWYFSLLSLQNLFAMHSMEIFDARRESVHGGSMKVYVCRKGDFEKTEQLKKYLEEEKQKKIDSINVYFDFAKRVKQNREKLKELVYSLKKQGKKIVGYAAASKGTIVQNYCDLNNQIIDYISDSTPFKQGLFSPGKHIPVVSPDIFHEDVKNNKIDYVIIFAWNHAKEIMNKEQEFLKKGGKFIVHLPEPRILSEEGGKDLEKTHVDTTQHSELIEGVEIKKLKVFANDQGYLFETLRNDDSFYNKEFGQVLIFEVYPGVIKGYHLHEKHDEYVTCVKGNIKYVVVKEYPDGTKKINTFVIGERNPMLLKIPRGVWRGYMPLENKSAMVMDIMSRPYDPKDPDTLEKDVFSFGDVWKVGFG